LVFSEEGWGWNILMMMMMMMMKSSIIK
jgi:hypothetical protein